MSDFPQPHWVPPELGVHGQVHGLDDWSCVGSDDLCGTPRTKFLSRSPIRVANGCCSWFFPPGTWWYLDDTPKTLHGCPRLSKTVQDCPRPPRCDYASRVPDHGCNVHFKIDDPIIACRSKRHTNVVRWGTFQCPVS